MLKKVLITGGTGFIGSHVVEALLERGCDVALLKHPASGLSRLGSAASKVRSYATDGDLHAVFAKEKPEAVLHLATYYRKSHAPEDVDPMMAANIGFPGRLLESARAHGVSLFVNTGTFFEYKNRPLPVKEDSAESFPFNLYAMTKIAFEGMLKNFGVKHGLRSVTLKIFTPYGPRDNDKKLIPTLVRKALANEDISLSQGLQKLDFVFVKDIARAYVQCLEKAERFGPEHQAVNVGTGFPHSVREVVSILEEILGRPLKKTWGPPAAADFDITFADTEKARRLLDWAPAADLFEGLKQTVEHERRRAK